MLLAQLNGIEIFLDPGYALLRHPTGRTFSFTSSAGLDGVLACVSQAFTEAKWARAWPRLPMTLVLGSKLCTAVSIAIPTGLANWQEVQAVKLASAAATLGVHPDSLIVAHGTFGASVVGCMLRSDHQAIMQWGESLRCRIRAMTPVWAVATQCAAARSASKIGIAVIEAGAISVVANVAASGYCAANFRSSGDTSSLRAPLNRFLVANAIALEQLAVLRLTTEAQPRRRRLPKVLNDHWVLEGE